MHSWQLIFLENFLYPCQCTMFLPVCSSLANIQNCCLLSNPCQLAKLLQLWKSLPSNWIFPKMYNSCQYLKFLPTCQVSTNLTVSCQLAKCLPACQNLDNLTHFLQSYAKVPNSWQLVKFLRTSSTLANMPFSCHFANIMPTYQIVACFQTLANLPNCCNHGNPCQLTEFSQKCITLAKFFYKPWQYTTFFTTCQILENFFNPCQHTILLPVCQSVAHIQNCFLLSNPCQLAKLLQLLADFSSSCQLATFLLTCQMFASMPKSWHLILKNFLNPCQCLMILQVCQPFPNTPNCCLLSNPCQLAKLLPSWKSSPTYWIFPKMYNSCQIFYKPWKYMTFFTTCQILENFLNPSQHTILLPVCQSVAHIPNCCCFQMPNCCNLLPISQVLANLTGSCQLAKCLPACQNLDNMTHFLQSFANIPNSWQLV